jgi:AcrR family transcriptional regulator
MAETNNNENIQNLPARKIQSAKTRQLLFDTAVRLFTEKGFYNVKIQDITKEAGTSKGSFYTHFDAKQDIIVEEYKALDNEYIKLRDEISQFDNAEEQLFYFVENVYRLCNEIFGFELTYVIYDTQLTYSKKDSFIIDETRPLYYILEKIIVEGQKSNELTDEIKPKEMTKMIIRLMRGTLYDWCLYDGEFDSVKEGMTLMRLFFKGIKK